AVDSTNFVTVISRDGNLDDAQPGRVKLDDDLRVEMKIVSVSMEGHLLECLARIETVARMKLAQRHAQHRVLEGREDLVAYVLVQRHSSLQRLPFLHHSRAEHCVGFACLQGLQ